MSEPAGLHAFVEAIERWHEFYLMTGTAAVTLVGLLFVAISLHLETLLHDHRAHLLDLARQTLLAFVYVLLVSLMFLVPPSTPRILGLTLAGATVTVLALAVAGFVREQRSRVTGLSRASLARRRLLQIAALVVALGVSVRMMGGHHEDAVLLIAPICILLGNATGSAWDLLVQVGRLKAGNTPT